MSTFMYNDVQLPYSYSTAFDQTVVYEEKDWYLTKYDIKIQCVLNSNYLSVMFPTLVGKTTNPADIESAIRGLLMKPRKSLSYKFNEVELIPQAQTGLAGTVDARNGPTPQGMSLIDLTNTSFLLTYHIIAHYWEKAKVVLSSPSVTNQVGSAILYNRWTESVDIDDCNYTTRTREGKYAIRSDNVFGRIADEFRSGMAVLGIPYGFLRQSSNYSVSPDGLTIMYRIVDKEIFKIPPQPAFKAAGTYHEHTTRLDAKRYARCEVTLHGDKLTSQSVLIGTAVAIVAAKLRLRGVDFIIADTNLRSILEGASVQWGLYDNSCTVSMTVMLPSLKFRFGGASWLTGANNITPGSIPGPTNPVPPYLDRGTADILLQAAAYFDPSLQMTFSRTQGQLRTPGGTVEVGQAGRRLES